MDSVYILHKNEFNALLQICKRHQNISSAAASVLNILKNIKASDPVAWHNEKFNHIMTDNKDIASRWNNPRPLYNYKF